MCPGVRLEGWLRWFSLPLGGVECRGHMHSLFLLPALLKQQLGFGLFVSCYQ